MRSSRKRSSALTKAARVAREQRKREAREKVKALRAHAKAQARGLAKSARAARAKARKIAAAKKAVIAACAGARSYLLGCKKELRAIVAGYQRHVLKVAKADAAFCKLADLAEGTGMTESDTLRDELFDIVESATGPINDYQEQIS